MCQLHTRFDCTQMKLDVEVGFVGWAEAIIMYRLPNLLLIEQSAVSEYDFRKNISKAAILYEKGVLKKHSHVIGSS